MKVRLILLSLFISCANVLTAQTNQVRFEHYSVEDGVSQGNILCTFQDKEGFLWFGTQAGLNKFNGYRFEKYTHTPLDTTSLSNAWIYSITEDNHHNLWLGTREGLNKLDRKTSTFTRWLVKPGTPNSLADNLVYGVTHHEGKILVNSPPFLSIIHVDTNEISHFRNPLSTEKTSGVHEKGLPLLVDVKKNVWISSPNGLSRFNLLTETFTHYVHSPTNPFSIPHNFINTIYQDKQGELWIGSKKGLCRYDAINDQFKRVEGFFQNDSILSILQESNYTFWIGTYGGGLNRMVLDSSKSHIVSIKNFRYDLNDSGSLTSDVVYSLEMDRSQIVWIGTYAGINKLDLKTKKFNLFRKTESHNSINLLSNFIASIYRDNEHGLWVGNWGQGLNIIDTRTGKVTHYAPTLHGKHKIADGYVHVIFKDSNNTIWIGTRNGIQIFNPADSSFTDLNTFAQTSNFPSFKNVRIRKLFEDSQHTIWVCTDNGLFQLDLLNKKAVSFETSSSEISDNLVYDILEDENKKLWIGTFGGLDLYDPTTNSFQHFRKNPEQKNSLSSNTIICLLTDRDGDLWVGTNSGLHLLNYGSSDFTCYTTSDGLPDMYIYNIVQDRRGKIWFSTNGGLSVLDKRTHKIKTYTHEDGLQGLEFNGGACFQSEAGELFFGGGAGFNSFFPDHLPLNKFIPPVAITSFDKSDNISSKRMNIYGTKVIELSYLDYEISIHFAALDYTNPQRNLYAYKMQGLSDKWIDLGNRNFVSFAKLPPGKYTFTVRGSNNDAFWNVEGASINIVIHPPWWRTTPVYVFCIVILVALVFYYINLRENKLLIAKVALEKTVRERTDEVIRQKEELAQHNEDLLQSREEISSQRDMVALQYARLQQAQAIIESQNEEIRLRNENLEEEVEKRTKELIDYNHQLEQFAFISAHNLRAPVATILGLGHIIELSKEDEEGRKVIYDKLIATTRELDRVVRDLNTILEIKKNNTSVVVEINLEEELKLIQVNLEKELTETKAVIHTDFSKVGSIHTIKPYLDSILLNLISNAIKYRNPVRTPVISIRAEIKDNFLCLIVQDNGLGIDLSLHKDKIFTLYQRFHLHVEGKGLGLYLVKTQVLTMGGKIEIESELNTGTTFYIYIPLKS